MSHGINVLASQACQLRKRPGKQRLLDDTVTPHPCRGDRTADGDCRHYSTRGRQVPRALWPLVRLVNGYRGAHRDCPRRGATLLVRDRKPTKYAGYTMPSTYPARLGLLFVGLCLLYILREVMPPRVSIGRRVRWLIW